MKYLNDFQGDGYEEEDYEDDEDYEDGEGYSEEDPPDELDKQFLDFLKDGVGSPKNEYKYFKGLSEEDKKYLESIEEIKNEKIDKPRFRTIESSTSLNNKSVILNKLPNF